MKMNLYMKCLKKPGKKVQDKHKNIILLVIPETPATKINTIGAAVIIVIILVCFEILFKVSVCSLSKFMHLSLHFTLQFVLILNRFIKFGLKNVLIIK